MHTRHAFALNRGSTFSRFGQISCANQGNAHRKCVKIVVSYANIINARYDMYAITLIAGNFKKMQLVVLRGKRRDWDRAPQLRTLIRCIAHVVLDRVLRLAGGINGGKGRSSGPWDIADVSGCSIAGNFTSRRRRRFTIARLSKIPW